MTGLMSGFRSTGNFGVVASSQDTVLINSGYGAGLTTFLGTASGPAGFNGNLNDFDLGIADGQPITIGNSGAGGTAFDNVLLETSGTVTALTAANISTATAAGMRATFTSSTVATVDWIVPSAVKGYIRFYVLWNPTNPTQNTRLARVESGTTPLWDVRRVSGTSRLALTANNTTESQSITLTPNVLYRIEAGTDASGNTTMRVYLGESTTEETVTGTGLTGIAAWNKARFGLISNAQTYTQDYACVGWSPDDWIGAAGSPLTVPLQHIASASNASNTTTVSVTIPATTQVGDLLILTSACGSSSKTITWPGTFTGPTKASVTGHHSAWAWKIAEAGDIGASITVTLSSAIDQVATISTFRGTATDFSGSKWNSVTGSASNKTPTVTTIPAGSAEICILSRSDAPAPNTFTAPNGYTEVIEQASAAGYTTISINLRKSAAPSTVGSASWTLSTPGGGTGASWSICPA